MKSLKKFLPAFVLTLAATVSVSGIMAFAKPDAVSGEGMWITGDFHNHTYLTDGSYPEETVLANAFDKYGLNWLANSEHGGTSERTPFGTALANPVWRWETLKEQSFPILNYFSMKYENKLLLQGVEWNVPTHEHASVAILADDGKAISDFEYVFDAGDNDTSRTMEGLPKINTTHADAVAGAKYLQDTYKGASYYILNHPSRKLKFSVADIRDFNNAAPDVAFGIEGIPGHQKESSRGGYGSDFGANTYKARTYGGADYMIAKVGGLWDALLGEGRQFYTFVNSDFHSDVEGDFWPGEYSKNYTFVDGMDGSSVIAGLRSGNSFSVLGDLIDALDFKAANGTAGATMGQTLTIGKGSDVTITIRFKSPAKNNNGDAVKVDHVDLISGDVTGKAAPGTPAYNKDTNDTTKIASTFTNGQFKKDSDGYYSITYKVSNVQKGMYFRLRGTNLAPGTKNETDAAGNPLIDDLVGENNAQKAYADLWFYSNPIFIAVR